MYHRISNHRALDSLSISKAPDWHKGFLLRVPFIALLKREALSEKTKEMKKSCFQVLNLLLLEFRNIGR